jgi:anti-sigma regulatory factor (Ser/Thr protein kinase)
MLTSQRFAIHDESQVGGARRAVADICRKHATNETAAGRIAITVTELGRNLVRHAGGGELVIREIPGSPSFGVEVLSIDRGPGIRNIGEAFRDGFSTGGTSGQGLGAVKRLSDRFDIYTQPGKGTIVSSFVGDVPACRFEIGAVSVPLQTELVCGDRWDFIEVDAGARLLLADGLGHGPFAEEAAREAIIVFRKQSTSSPAQTMDLVHLALGKTRGAAGAMVTLDLVQGRLTSSGVGNISMRLVSDESARSLISDNGTLGSNARKAHEAHIPWHAESSLVMHSDGLGSHWNLKDYPGISARHPSILAGLLYRDHRRERDDSTVIVLRERRT